MHTFIHNFHTLNSNNHPLNSVLCSEQAIVKTQKLIQFQTVILLSQHEAFLDKNTETAICALIIISIQ